MAKSKLATTELKGILDNYDRDITALVKIKPQQFDIVAISTMIRETPQRKWNAAQGIVNATIYKKDADNKLKVAKAVEMLKASKNRETSGLSNVDDRKAHVDSLPDIQSAEIDAINAEAELLAAKLAYECLDDLFTAGKKIMEYLVSQERATNQYNRFVDEGRRGGAKL